MKKVSKWMKMELVGKGTLDEHRFKKLKNSEWYPCL
jgi:hypothetical protein